MHVQINTDSNIDGRERLLAHVTGVVEGALGRFNDRITRVEVHLSDQGGPEHGPYGKRCMMEARLRGRKPTAVIHDAKTLDRAIEGAVDKLHRSLTRGLARLRHHD